MLFDYCYSTYISYSKQLRHLFAMVIIIKRKREHKILLKVYNSENRFLKKFCNLFRYLRCVSIQMFITADALTYGLQCTCVIIDAFATNDICHFRNR